MKVFISKLSFSKRRFFLRESTTVLAFKTSSSAGRKQETRFKEVFGWTFFYVFEMQRSYCGKNIS